MTLTSQKKKELTKKYGNNESNIGSVEVQIAMLTERIKYLEDHFKEHKKDNHSRRGLIALVSKRRKLLQYIARREYGQYQELIKKLKIRR